MKFTSAVASLLTFSLSISSVAAGGGSSSAGDFPTASSSAIDIPSATGSSAVDVPTATSSIVDVPTATSSASDVPTINTSSTASDVPSITSSSATDIPTAVPSSSSSIDIGTVSSSSTDLPSSTPVVIITTTTAVPVPVTSTSSDVASSTSSDVVVPSTSSSVDIQTTTTTTTTTTKPIKRTTTQVTTVPRTTSKATTVPRTTSKATSSKRTTTEVTTVPRTTTQETTVARTTVTDTPPVSRTTTYSVKEPVQTAQPDINNNGGSVLANGIKVYGIFYGDHSTLTKSLVQKFVTGLGASDWWTTVMTYKGDNGAVTSDVKWSGVHNDDYSKGKALAAGDIDSIIDAAIAANKWKSDATTDIYAVFTAKDVAESNAAVGGSFCKEYCGYHTQTASSGLIYSFVGDATRCPGTLPPPGAKLGTAGCMQRYWRNQTDETYSVNGDQHADAFVDVLAHEIAESASDYANTYRDSTGFENGDKCAAYMLDVKGITTHSPYNGAYNVEFGSQKWLIQSMWSADKQGCVLKESDTPVIPASGAAVSSTKPSMKKLY